MLRIESLNEQQISAMIDVRDEWTKIGLCTDKADRPRAEAAINEMYKQGGLEPPKKIVWCDSPLSQGLVVSILKNIKQNYLPSLDSARASVLASTQASVWDSVGASVLASVEDSVLASVWASVWDSVWASVGASVRASVGASVRASVWDSVGASVLASVWDSVGASVGASVRASVGASVGDSVWDSVGDSVWASVGASVYGQHEAHWLAFCRFFKEHCGLSDQTHKLEGFWELAKSAGWAYPTKDICFVSERHTTLLRDDRGRLHSTTGPAIQYPDGWEIYAVHGVRVPEHIINKQSEITTAQIDDQQNTEIRRVMIDFYGQARYLQDSGAILVSKDRFGNLWKKDLSEDEPIVIVEVKNSTPEPDGSIKDYFLRVPPDMSTPQEAIAWTFNLKKNEYHPLVET